MIKKIAMIAAATICMAAPASAQLARPMATPQPTLAMPALPALPTAYQSVYPTSEPIDALPFDPAEIIGFLEEANEQLAIAPENIFEAAGVNLVQIPGSDLEDAGNPNVFDYAQWLFSAGAGEQIFGDFAPIAQRIGFIFFAIIFVAFWSLFLQGIAFIVGIIWRLIDLIWF